MNNYHKKCLPEKRIKNKNVYKESHHSFLGIDTPVSEGDVGNHCTDETGPIE